VRNISRGGWRQISRDLNTRNVFGQFLARIAGSSARQWIAVGRARVRRCEKHCRATMFMLFSSCSRDLRNPPPEPTNQRSSSLTSNEPHRLFSKSGGSPRLALLKKRGALRLFWLLSKKRGRPDVKRCTAKRVNQAPCRCQWFRWRSQCAVSSYAPHPSVLLGAQ
jgi:hypothetical protein